MTHSGKRRRRLWGPVGVALLVVALASALTATSALGRGAASMTPIKIGILSDCQGAFGAFYDQDIAGAIAAFSEYAGARPKNPRKPSAGMVGGRIGTHPIQIVGFGCGNDRADKAIVETRRLMEQLDADIMIGPLSGDEAIAVANYAKAHPTKTFVNGTAGSQDPTLRVKAPNFYRFHGDGAQWNAGLGELAYKNLGWRNVAVIADDYSFAWTSAGGFIADFCAVGGKITKRVFPPLNTTDYSSFAQQLPAPDAVDGYFWAVGGAGLIPSLKAFEQAHGPIDGKKFIGNGFWAVTGFEQLGNRANGAYAGTFGTAGDLKTARAKKYAATIAKWFKAIPPFGSNAQGQQASSNFLYNYYNATWGLIKALKAVDGDISDNQKQLQTVLSKTSLPGAAYGPIRLDKNRNGIQGQYIQRLGLSDGKLVARTVRYVPNVEQSFGGLFKGDPPPSRTVPACVKKTLPWHGKSRPVVNGVIR
jgi:branched-chain amino acid transport system substrate-binding protein